MRHEAPNDAKGFREGIINFFFVFISPTYINLHIIPPLEERFWVLLNHALFVISVDISDIHDVRKGWKTDIFNRIASKVEKRVVKMPNSPPLVDERNCFSIIIGKPYRLTYRRPQPGVMFQTYPFAIASGC